MYDIGALYEAHSVEEALALRLEHPEARLIAGGSDLLVKIRDGKLPGVELISIRDIPELHGVCLRDDGTLRIGPLTSFSELTANELIGKYIRVLGEAADEVGGPQIRNIGTVGGNICNGATSADTATTLFAYDAELVLRGRDGARKLDISDFYLGPGKTDVRPGELLTDILIPWDSLENTHGRYIKYSARNSLDIATLGCSVNLRLSSGLETIERLRLSYGVAGPTPCRCPVTESRSVGMSCTDSALRELAASAVAEISPRDSWRASRAFRLHIAEECAYRAMRDCVERAGGAI